MSTGFEIINQQLWVTKDPEAQLVYTLDWTDWLGTDSIASAVFTVNARVNDPEPLLKVSSGISDGTKTYIELSSGQLNKSYLVTIKITTDNGSIDARSFHVKIAQKSL